MHGSMFEVRIFKEKSITVQERLDTFAMLHAPLWPCWTLLKLVLLLANKHSTTSTLSLLLIHLPLHCLIILEVHQDDSD